MDEDVSSTIDRSDALNPFYVQTVECLFAIPIKDNIAPISSDRTRNLCF